MGRAKSGSWMTWSPPPPRSLPQLPAVSVTFMQTISHRGVPPAIRGGHRAHRVRGQLPHRGKYLYRGLPSSRTCLGRISAEAWTLVSLRVMAMDRLVCMLARGVTAPAGDRRAVRRRSPEPTGRAEVNGKLSGSSFRGGGDCE